MTNNPTITEQQLAIVRQEISDARANAEPAVKLAQAVKRLLENQDFQEVVSKTYFDEELKRVALAISMNGNNDLVARDVVRLKGIHCFREFLNTLLKNGEVAEQYLSQSDEDLLAHYLANYDLGDE